MHAAEAPACHLQTPLPPPAPRARTGRSEPHLVVHICDVHAVEDVVPEVVAQHPPQDVEGDVGPGAWGRACRTARRGPPPAAAHRPPHSPAHCAVATRAGSAGGPACSTPGLLPQLPGGEATACGSKHQCAAQDAGHGAAGQRAHGPCVLSDFSIVYVDYLQNGDVYLKNRRSQKGRDALWDHASRPPGTPGPCWVPGSSSYLACPM